MTEEPLHLLFEAIKRGAEERGLIVYPGVPWLGGGDAPYPVAAWVGNWTDYIDLAVRVGATFLYADAALFDFHEAIRVQATDLDGDWDGDEPPADSSGCLGERILQRLDQFGARTGEVTFVRCVWFKDGVAHQLSVQAAWLVEFSEGLDAILAEVEALEEIARVARTQEEAVKVHELARRLSRHERFPEANSDAKRQFMAQQLFPKMVSSSRSIAERASLIYWWEVEPEARVSKAEKARELYRQGESARNIAAILKMPEPKVRAAIADA